MKPLIAINFKTYESSVGLKALKLAQICDDIAPNASAEIIVCVSAPQIGLVSQHVSIKVFGQHVDGVDFGAHTGKILAEDIKEAGAAGSLINHSEDQLALTDIERAVKTCKDFSLVTICCADSVEMVKKVLAFSPDFIAYEPPALIGGDISVTTQPQVIQEVVRIVQEQAPSVKVLVGAGVKKAEDVRIALQLGCAGVLLASGITKATNPKNALLELLAGVNSQ